MMAKRRLPYGEGDCFLVPLRDGRKALGVIARIDGKGGVIGYFFGLADPALPPAEAIASLTSDAPLLRASFADPGLLRGDWKLVGRVPAWRRDDWPLPAFVRRDAISGAAKKVSYAEGDFHTEVALEHCSDGEAKVLPEDGVMGPGFVEIRLTKLLTDLPAASTTARRVGN